MLVVIAVGLFFLCITAMGGKSKIYCRIFEKEDWFVWEKVIKNFDSVEYAGHFEYEYSPELNNHKFILVVDGNEYHILYWDATDSVGVHDVPGIEYQCLSNFDKYHSNLLKSMLIEKFDLKKK